MDGNNEGGQNQGESLVLTTIFANGTNDGRVGGPEYRLKMQKRVIDRQLLRVGYFAIVQKRSGRAIAGKHWAMLRTSHQGLLGMLLT